MTTKRLPRPVPSLRATTRPPCRRTRFRTTKSPSPRPATVRCLSDAGIEWQVVSEVSHIDVICALVRADLAVAPLLRSTVPSDLTVLGPAHDLPILPAFNINLHSALTKGGANEAELAVHIEKEFHSRAAKRL